MSYEPKGEKNMEHKERKAWLSGKVAASNDLPRIPALDSNIEDLLDGLRVGESAAILNAWLEGYDEKLAEGDGIDNRNKEKQK